MGIGLSEWWVARVKWIIYGVRRNMVHRHEIPVTSTPVKILHRDDEHGFIVIDKPGSIVSIISFVGDIFSCLWLACTCDWTVLQEQPCGDP